MPSVRPSIEDGSAKSSDPWDWSVEEVVAALCDPNSPLRKTHPSSSYPNEAALAAKIREFDVTGLALLKKINEERLRIDFGVKSIGQIASLEELIDVLQLESAKYQAREAHRHSSTAARSSIKWTSRLATPYNTTFFQSGPAPGSLLPWQSPLDVDSGGPSPTREFGIRQYAPLDVRPRNLLGEIPPSPQHNTLAPQIPAILGTNTASRSNEWEVKVSIEDDSHITDRARTAIEKSQASGLTTQQDRNVGAQGQTIITDKYGRKRKRLAPTLVSALASTEGGYKLPIEEAFTSESHVSHDALPMQIAEDKISKALTDNFRVPTHSPQATAEHTSGTSETRPSTSRKVPEPGVAYLDSTGRKRLVPILQSALEDHPDQHSVLGSAKRDTHTEEVVQSHHVSSKFAASSQKLLSLGRKAQRLEGQIYLGLESFVVDELFYGKTELGGSLYEPDDISNNEFSFFHPTGSSAGQRLYVHNRMKHFLQAKPLRLHPEVQRSFGLMPYPSRIGRKHHPLSITVFAKDAVNNVIARRLNRSKILKDDPMHTPNVFDSGNATNIFNTLGPSLAVDDVDDQAWTALEKWKYVDGHEKVLPLYGDSGSEGEYDMETWKEMEKEVGYLGRTEERSRKPPLSNSAVEEAIDNAMKALVQEWQSKMQPKLQMKAWRIWARAERSKARQHKVQQLEEAIQKIEHRVQTHRNEIAAENWSDVGRLMRQCQIMQPSIFDIETHQWEKGILQLSKPPPKDPSQPKKPKAAPVRAIEKQTLAEGEEDLSSEPHDSDITEDSLDDFIVDDDKDQAEMAGHAMLDEEFTMADNEGDGGEEDEVGSDTLVLDDGLVASKNFDSSPLKAEALPNLLDKLNTEQHMQPELDIIDLTQISSDNDPVITGIKRERTPGVKTPPVEDSKDSEPWLPTLTKFKIPAFAPRPEDNIIDLDTSSDDFKLATPSRTFKSEKPAFSDIQAIQKMDPKQLVEQQDRKRLLIWIIAHTPRHQRDLALDVLTAKSMEFVQDYVCLALKAFKAHRTQLRQLGTTLSNSIMQIAAWDISWTIPVVYTSSGLNVDHVETTLTEISEFEIFYDFLLLCMKPYENPMKPTSSVIPLPSIQSPFITPQKSKKQKTVQEHIINNQKSVHRKRGHAVQESQETLAKRRSARERLEKDEERRRQRHREELQSILTKACADAVNMEIIVNPGKSDDQEYIRLDPRFGNGKSLKPHQIEGLQFLWRELTADADDLQGCLLAHTMGLGKTIQVIALLVALAGASQSLETSIRQQVPTSLQTSQTLILCPPALVENWLDELESWLPGNRNDTVGLVRTVTAAKLLDHRVSEISKWQDEGGILLMAYSTFADLVINKKNGKEIRPLREDDHQNVKTALLNDTKLVIADEAHEFKNQGSRLSKCVNQISTKSRVAMTGSPLSNNLAEYYFLIDWISPKFLGTPAEFRATYQDPIHEGLWRGCEDKAYRQALKRLKALQLEMEPKVHRADISVLHSALHGKMEFVIRLPLGEIQEKLYRIFVDITMQSLTDGEPQQAVLWMWLKLMQLLCFHPKVYQDRLHTLEPDLKAHSEKKPIFSAKGGRKGLRKTSPEYSPVSDDDDEIILTQPESQSTLQRVIIESQTYLSGLNQDLTDTSLSYKMQTLAHIVQLSIVANDKILIFSHRRLTLDFIAAYLKSNDQNFERIDGRVPPQKRQAITKSFNKGMIDICLVSTRAGGVGLNLFGANRVVILDEWFNPMYEQQAIGRSYRIGQEKTVYVYRLIVAGTFEQVLQNQGLYKEQLAMRALDKKNPTRSSTKDAGHYIFQPKQVTKESLDEYKGKDTSVLDLVLLDHSKYISEPLLSPEEFESANTCRNPILSITPTESFHIEENSELTAEEAKEAEKLREDRELKRRDPIKYYERMREEAQKLGFGGAPASVLPSNVVSQHVSNTSLPLQVDVIPSTACVQHSQGKYSGNGSVGQA